MRTNVAHTSLDTYRSLPVAGYLQPKEAELMALFRNCDVALTREQAAQRLGWKEASVCGRANSLVAKNRLEEVDGGITRSGRPAKLLRLPQPGQGALFGGETAQ
jgi:hypothetical protein